MLIERLLEWTFIHNLDLIINMFLHLLYHTSLSLANINLSHLPHSIDADVSALLPKHSSIYVISWSSIICLKLRKFTYKKVQMLKQIC